MQWFILVVLTVALGACTETSGTVVRGDASSPAEDSSRSAVKAVDWKTYEGKWQGLLIIRGDGTVPIRLSVLSVSETHAIVHYSQGHGTNFRRRAACWLRTWRVLPGGRLELNLRNETLALEIQNDPQTLGFKNTFGSFTVHSTLTRVPDSTDVCIRCTATTCEGG